eukprot:scaffold19626_cov66-Phaeocystis_antarctica.AAC.2
MSTAEVVCWLSLAVLAGLAVLVLLVNCGRTSADRVLLDAHAPRSDDAPRSDAPRPANFGIPLMFEILNFAESVACIILFDERYDLMFVFLVLAVHPLLAHTTLAITQYYGWRDTTVDDAIGEIVIELVQCLLFLFLSSWSSISYIIFVGVFLLQTGLIIWQHSSQSWAPQFDVDRTWPEWNDNFKRQVTMLAVTITPFFFSAASLYKIMSPKIADTAAALLNSKSFAVFQNTALLGKAVKDLKPDVPGSRNIFWIYTRCVAVAGGLVLSYAVSHAVYLMLIHEVEPLLTPGFFLYILVAQHANLVALMWCTANCVLFFDSYNKEGIVREVVALQIIAFFATKRWMDAGFRFAVSPPPPVAPPRPPMFPPEPMPPAQPPPLPVAWGMFNEMFNDIDAYLDADLPIMPIWLYCVYVFAWAFAWIGGCCFFQDSWFVRGVLSGPCGLCLLTVWTTIGVIVAPLLLGDD